MTTPPSGGNVKDCTCNGQSIHVWSEDTCCTATTMQLDSTKDKQIERLKAALHSAEEKVRHGFDDCKWRTFLEGKVGSLETKLSLAQDALEKIDGMEIEDVQNNLDLGKMKVIAKKTLEKLC